MPPKNEDTSSVTPSRLLKGAALAFAVFGGGMAAWGLDKWIRYPGSRASQFGFEAPLWPAFVVFTVLATTAVVALLWIAARRSERGEDPFARRHRRGHSPADGPPNEQDLER